MARVVGAGALRFVLCTSGGLNGALVLDRLLSSPRFEAAGIVRSTRALRPGQGLASAAREYVGRSGAAYLAYIACSAPLADRALGALSVSCRARAHAIPLLDTDRVNGGDAVAFVASARPDVVISAFFNQRIGNEVLGTAPLGGVNVHPGALPAFRGVDPVFRARLASAPSLEASVHRVTPELDAGALLGRTAVAHEPGESVLRATARVYAAGAALLQELADAIATRAPGEPQDEAAARYDTWPTRGEVAMLRRRGVALARWSDLREAGRIVESARTPPPRKPPLR